MAAKTKISYTVIARISARQSSQKIFTDLSKALNYMSQKTADNEDPYFTISMTRTTVVVDENQ